MSFPSGVAKLTVTGQNVTDFSGAPAQGLVLFAPSQPVEVSSGAAPPTVFAEPIAAEVIAGVMTSVLVPDSHHGFGTSFTYTITLKLEGMDVDQVYTGVSITADTYPSGTVDLSQLV